MHDFLLAKQIVEELDRLAKEKTIKNIKSVSLEIGSISMSHDGHPEHLEEIDLDNLRFGLESLTQKNSMGKIDFKIKKVVGDNWKIVGIEVK